MTAFTIEQINRLQELVQEEIEMQKSSRFPDHDLIKEFNDIDNVLGDLLGEKQ